MEDMVCASCHKGLSLEEIERGSFKHLAGRVYCADCVAKMRRAGPTLCPQCGVQDTPLYNGKTYVCRKCGAEVGRKEPAAEPRPAAPRSVRKPLKKCPYCGALLAAEALRCRYCSSMLTREAHELDLVIRQNSRLRFWLGCCLTAAVFLSFSLIYLLAHSSAPATPPAAAAPPPAAPAPEKATRDPAQEFIKELRKELQAVRHELASLKDEQDRAARKDRPTVTVPSRVVAPEPPPPAKAPEPAAKGPGAPEPPPVKEAAKPPTSPDKAAPQPAPPAKAPDEPTKAPAGPPTPPAGPPATPSPKASPGPSPAKAEEPKAKAPELPRPSAAELAAAGADYQVLQAKLKDLKAARRYGEAIQECRHFLGQYPTVPHSKLVKADQDALRHKVQELCDEHMSRFRQEAEKGDLEAAKRVADNLERYDAPEAREARSRMLDELKAAQAKVPGDEARYLAQWETPPHVGRLLRELKSEKECDARGNAAKELGRTGHSAALGGLIEALHDPKDKDWYVAVCVLKALEDIGDPVALPHVAPLTRASFPAVSVSAAEACRALARAPRDKFADAWRLADARKVAGDLADSLALGGKDDAAGASRYQIALVEALALLEVKEAAPALRTVLASQDPEVRKAARAAFKKLTGEDPPAEAPPKAPPQPGPRVDTPPPSPPRPPLPPPLPPGPPAKPPTPSPPP